ncbi:hypothetical protein OS493_001571 [Desmophyllum pertusum]|uniref:SAM domain-containing protein n=1 Tax=Desmophyllum pertusum TaxID=174260 RepID=A0A9X0CI63_9CNID|nr:hypothetical protein OS493_034096 [Desmophyllum pertusum]KAJ7381435.1 hypothetical protein OS493_001571 [Desmophyllum pertusum]
MLQHYASFCSDSHRRRLSLKAPRFLNIFNSTTYHGCEEWTAEAASEWLTRHVTSLDEPYNEYTKAFLDMDIDGDGLLGLVENGGNALAAEIIPNVAHRLKVIRKINYLARHQGDGNIAR